MTETMRIRELKNEIAYVISLTDHEMTEQNAAYLADLWKELNALTDED